jgi:hypothetical protein
MTIELAEGCVERGEEKNKGNNQKNVNEDSFFCPFYLSIVQ